VRSLLPLQMEGCHTQDIEALPSYMLRLAAVHGVTPGGLIRHVARGTPEETALMAASRGQSISTLVRPNATSILFAAIIACTHAENTYNLERGTFVLLSPALARSPSTFTHRFRWCPACFHEQLLEVGNAYFKLAWFLAPVRACDQHRILLRDCCPHCGQCPKPWHGWARFDRCQNCNKRMDVVVASDAVTRDPELLASDLIALVSEIAVASGPVPAGAACRYLNRVFDEAWRHVREEELWNKVPRDDCIRYCNPEEPMTMGVARRLAYQLEIPIADFLRGVDGTSQSFGFAATCPLPRSMRAVHRQGVINAPVLVKQMELFLDDGVTPVPLREVARQLGVSVGALRYHAPMLASKLVARSEQYRRTTQAQKEVAVVQAVLDGVRSWSAGNATPIAKKPLLRMLRKKTGLPKEKLRKAIQRLLRDQVA